MLWQLLLLSSSVNEKYFITIINILVVDWKLDVVEAGLIRDFCVYICSKRIRNPYVNCKINNFYQSKMMMLMAPGIKRKFFILCEIPFNMLLIICCDGYQSVDDVMQCVSEFFTIY